MYLLNIFPFFNLNKFFKTYYYFFLKKKNKKIDWNFQNTNPHLLNKVLVIGMQRRYSISLGIN
jgi:hypothetical protein